MSKKERMDDITLTLPREEFQQLLLIAGIGDFVRGAVLEGRYGSPGDEGELLGKLLDLALAHGLSEAQQHDDHADPSEAFEKEQTAFIDEYIDDEFWNALELRLGKRDFERSATAADREYIEHNPGKLPVSAREHYERYADEFETFGIDRLEINKDAPVSDIRDALQ